MKPGDFQWVCPTCGCAGVVIKNAPATERQCKNGHRWADGRHVPPPVYIPMRTRLEEARGALQAAQKALDQAETMIKDCASFLTPAQRTKLAVHSELHNIVQEKAKIGFHIELMGGKVNEQA